MLLFLYHRNRRKRYEKEKRKKKNERTKREILYCTRMIYLLVKPLHHLFFPSLFVDDDQPSSSPLVFFYILISFFNIIITLLTSSSTHRVQLTRKKKCIYTFKTHHASFSIQVDMPDLFYIRPRPLIMFLYYKLSDTFNYTPNGGKNKLETTFFSSNI